MIARFNESDGTLRGFVLQGDAVDQRQQLIQRYSVIMSGLA